MESLPHLPETEKELIRDTLHTGNGREEFSLSELNSLVRQSIELCLPETYWVRAEVSDVRVNSSGHCYLEFVENKPRGREMLAKARGMIWANVFQLLKPYFEETTGETFRSGIQVLVEVSVNFHEVYGYSLTVRNIDPTYTLGDMSRRRREILERLKEEGVLTLNKELPIPVLPQRIAVISSATAAGYDDFSHQLKNNEHHFYFETELFPALMQGNRVEESVLAALDAINLRSEEFDVVVIIRGGGAASELSCFDSYALATVCAQFPLPVITGIGHERDDTVLDVVANTRVKTPTAAAEFLIARMNDAAEQLERLTAGLYNGTSSLLDRARAELETIRHRLPSKALASLSANKMKLVTAQKDLLQLTSVFFVRNTHRLDMLAQRLEDMSPEKQLARGYTITLKDGKALKTTDGLNPGDEIVTRYHRGETISRILSREDIR